MAMFRYVSPNYQLYWRCHSCGKYNEWPQEKTRKFCNSKCREADKYRRRKARGYYDKGEESP